MIDVQKSSIIWIYLSWDFVVLCATVFCVLCLYKALIQIRKGEKRTLLLNPGSVVYNSFKQTIAPLTCNQELILQVLELMWILDMVSWYKSVLLNCSSIGSYEAKIKFVQHDLYFWQSCLAVIWAVHSSETISFLFFFFSFFLFKLERWIPSAFYTHEWKIFLFWAGFSFSGWHLQNASGLKTPCSDYNVIFLTLFATF